MTEPAAVPVEGALDTPRRWLLVSAGARTVEVEGPDDLDALAYLVSVLWGIAGGETEPRIVAGGMGFCADLVAPTGPVDAGPDDTDPPPEPGRPLL